MTVASIDIGTNTVLLLIADVDTTSGIITPIVDKLSMPRIGKGLEQWKKIQDENLLRLYTVLDEYNKIIKEYSCVKTLVNATNAFRIASNQKEIVEEVRKVFDLNINVISGETEALYSLLGAISNSNVKNNSLIIDIGGGSTEIIIGESHSIEFRKSFPIGVVALTEKHFTTQPPSQIQIESLRNELKRELYEIQNMNYKFSKAIAVAGTPTTLSCIKNKILNFDAELIDGSCLTPKEIDKMIIQLSHLTVQDMQTKFGSVVEGREDILLSGALILKQIVEYMSIDGITVSTRGIRHGAIVNYLNSI